MTGRRAIRSLDEAGHAVGRLRSNARSIKCTVSLKGCSPNLSQKLPCLTDGVQSSGVQHCHRNSVQLSALNSDGLNVQTGSVRLGAPSGCLFGASAKSIARLAAVTASSRLTACPERFPAVSNRTDHFQSPGLIPCRIRYSTPRCSMQPTPEDD
jgi:hypothetical protein